MSAVWGRHAGVWLLSNASVLSFRNTLFPFDQIKQRVLRRRLQTTTIPNRVVEHVPLHSSHDVRHYGWLPCLRVHVYESMSTSPCLRVHVYASTSMHARQALPLLLTESQLLCLHPQTARHSRLHRQRNSKRQSA